MFHYNVMELMLICSGETYTPRVFPLHMWERHLLVGEDDMSNVNTLVQLGMDSKAADEAQESTTQEVEANKDHFIHRDGKIYAGTHLIVDLYQSRHLDDIDFIEDTLRACITESRATLLHFHLHRFEPNGVSGVAVLAESHISIHTWPEAHYAALVIFMCGDADPHACLPILEQAFEAGRMDVQEFYRGEAIDE